ncbi:hypothetical protein CXF85_06985 [Colwellia sp. 75C3]|uniref:hypothetical protein n=1 Tax=Colwellia sp. 75C3 TaxID=888425 RepID=UPI000C31F13D|nr:hypothetical protein [Colwellia sp. 75C3]PKG85330.1 hypothetical protein CXF85_06985 [Colwellia sp. 75C3]
MKLWTFVAGNPKKAQKNNYWTQLLSIISDSRDKGGVLGVTFPIKKKSPLTEVVLYPCYLKVQD